jgi:hypothetical protein
MRGALAHVVASITTCGAIKATPASWKDRFFEPIHSAPGS